MGCSLLFLKLFRLKARQGFNVVVWRLATISDLISLICRVSTKNVFKGTLDLLIHWGVLELVHILYTFQFCKLHPCLFQTDRGIPPFISSVPGPVTLQLLEFPNILIPSFNLHINTLRQYHQALLHGQAPKSLPCSCCVPFSKLNNLQTTPGRLCEFVIVWEGPFAAC